MSRHNRLLLILCIFTAAPLSLSSHNMPSARSGPPAFQARVAKNPLVPSGSLASFKPRGILVLRGGDSAKEDPVEETVIAEAPTEERAAEIRDGLERILLRLMHPDSDTIRSAEKEFEAICSDPVAAEQLAAIALDPPTADAVRLMAAILLRQRLTDLWGRMSAERQDALQVIPSSPNKSKAWIGVENASCARQELEFGAPCGTNSEIFIEIANPGTLC